MVKLAVFVEEALREAREAALGIAAACPLLSYGPMRAVRPGLLDAVDVRVLAERLIGLQSDVHAGTARDSDSGDRGVSRQG